jgi:cardiolipin synthase (CMP-forming)
MLLSQLKSMPNQLTLIRLVFIPFIIMAVTETPANYRLAMLLFILAGISDGLDGLLARILKQKTKLGEYLDPLADKLLLSSMFILLSYEHRIPWRITLMVFSRDIGIVIVALVLYMSTTLRDFSPSVFGKANTAAQVAAIFFVLLNEIDNALWVDYVTDILLWSVFGLAMLSGIHYIILVGRRLRTLPEPPHE